MNFGQLIEYPFNAQVWGTVSDWGMIIVTAGTAYLLWQTFRSQNRSIEIQNETLKEQQTFNIEQAKLNNLQFKQHLKSIRPYFVVTDEEKEYTAFREQRIQRFKTVRANGANAHNVTIKNIYNSTSFELHIPFISVGSNLDAEFFNTIGASGRGYITRGFDLDTISSSDESESIDLLSLAYEDEEANSYSQILFFRNGELYFTNPIFKTE